MKLLRTISFSLLAAVIAVLIAATVTEKIKGTPFVSQHIYSSPAFVALWTIMAASSLIYLFKRKVQSRGWTFALHLSFVIILCGAATTHFIGQQGYIHLRIGKQPTGTFTTSDGKEAEMPFVIQLEDFDIAYYTGTRSPMDYASHVKVTSGETTSEGTISMNNIFTYHNYRFYQSSYDTDMMGSTLAISHDPWGIGITYAGYAALLVSIIGFFFQHNTMFKSLSGKLRNNARRTATLLLMLLIPALSFAGGRMDNKVLPRHVADQFGQLLVYYNGRICPLETLARDFTVKLCGKDTYEGLTAEQVFTGWMFYYNYWKKEPIIKIKNGQVARLLGIDGKWACLDDFFTNTNVYKLEQPMTGGNEQTLTKACREADEKFNIASMATTGSIVKIFPCRTPEDGTLHWFSQIDKLPEGIAHDKWVFIRSSLNYVNELIVRRDYDKVIEVVSKIRKYQYKEAEGELPSDGQIRAEHFYNKAERPLVMGIVMIVTGIISFVISCKAMSCRRKPSKQMRATFTSLSVACIAWLTLTLCLRWYISGHLPMSNGFETMQFMAWCSLLIALAARRRFELAVPFGFIVAGMAVMVSMMGESNPQITQLMPVLSSPLLSVHVMMVMISYSLFAFMMLNGISALVIKLSARNDDGQIIRLADISRLLLYPAVFALTLGIFIGAIWANVSWGRYWGWDPKEVWALITLLIYALGLHSSSLPWFKNPMFFHLFTIVAFMSVIITYFGVNFILGGMHSYA